MHVYDVNLAACRASGGQSPACNNPVGNTFHALQVTLIALVLVVPALIGMFWGAPLIAHELETGTFRLAWTQSVSRRRWLFVKMGLVGLASALTAGLLSLMSTWWFSPIDKVSQSRFGPANFGLHGFVPAGYAAFAFALGVTAGLVFRRTLPAMAVTLAGFVATRLAVTYWLRPHYMSPATLNVPLSGADVGFQIAGPGSVSPVSMVAQRSRPAQRLGLVGGRRRQRRAGAEQLGRPARLPEPGCGRGTTRKGFGRVRPPRGARGRHQGVAGGTAAVQRLHLHLGRQVPRRRDLPAGQPVLDVPGR